MESGSNPQKPIGRDDIPGGGPRADPDHHLWRNGRLYWIAFTVHLPGWLKERVRFSLGTANRQEARRRRDEVLKRYPEMRGCALSLRWNSPNRVRTRRSQADPAAA